MKNFDYKKARQFLEEKENQRQKRLDEKFLQAQQDFEQIKNLIIEKYHPKRIFQWGSLLHREQFSEVSDIDIAVEGITSAEEIFKLYGEIMNMTRFSIDLIQMEKIEPEFVELIKSKGKLVYDCEAESTQSQKWDK